MTKNVRCEDWTPSDNVNLTSEQKEVITFSKNISLIAGPGTGKTEVLAQKANYLLQTGICKFPYKILALCYKVDAASNIRDRVKKRCSKNLSNRFQATTVDSFLISLIRRFYIFLPEWLNIRGDFSITDSVYRDNDWSDEYTKLTGGNIPKEYAPLNLDHISDNKELKKLWLYCKDKNEFDYNMCHTMAHHLIKYNPKLKDFISQTYKFIFLDEFQDMSERHYPSLQMIFQNSYNIVNAVGDYNQSIMGFAGAIPDAFNKFTKDFDAGMKELTVNHRSHQEVVKFINEIVKYLTPKGYTPISYSSSKEENKNSFVAVGTFNNEQEEAQYIINSIQRLKKEENLNYGDFVMILKQKAKDYFESVKDVFEANNVKLRNEDENACTKGIRIQDLMVDDFSKLLIFIIKLKLKTINISEKKELEYLLIEILNIDIEISKGLKKLNRTISNLLNSINDKNNNVSEWANNILTIIEEKKLIKLYKNKKMFDKAVVSSTTLLQQYVNSNPNNLINAIDEYLGINSVKLMTTHKSKGLEFNTVFFVDFKPDSWWTSDPKQSEETRIDSIKCFFVGLSRAKKRLFFTNPTQYWPEEIATLLNDSQMVIKFDV